jgi:hypothetical protein
MSVYTPVPTTIEMRRSRLLALVAAVAAAAAVITWTVLALTVNTGMTVARENPVDQAAFKQFVIGVSTLANAQQRAAEIYAQEVAAEQRAAFDRFAKGISLLARAQQTASVRHAGGLSPNDKRYIAGRTPRSIMDLTPGDLASGLWGYGVPSHLGEPTLQDVLGATSPESRRYVIGLMRLTFRQLAAGAAGSP